MTPQAQRSYRWLFWSLALLGLAVDQASKYGIFDALYDDAIHHKADRDTARADIIPKAFSFTVQISDKTATGTGLVHDLRTWSGPRVPHVNHGALFGMQPTQWLGRWGISNQANPDLDNQFFMAVSALAALGIIVWSLFRRGVRDRLLCVALGLILAGTLGNLYDRWVFNGVRDFLDWHGGFNWPVFNFADCCLVCGASLLLFQALTSKAPATQPAPAATAALPPPVGDHSHRPTGEPYSTGHAGSLAVNPTSQGTL